MKMKWERIYLIIVSVIAVIVLLLYFDGCNKQKQSESDFETLMDIHFRDSSELVKKVNELGQVTVTAEAFKLSQQSLNKYLEDNAELKKKFTNLYHQVSSINSAISNFHADTIRVPVPKYDTLPCGDIEKKYPVTNKDYSFDFTFKNKSGQAPEFLFLNFNIPDTATTIIGVKKSGFLNMKRTLVSEQVHTNSLIQTKGVQTIVKADAKPKTFKKIAIGFGMGVVAAVLVDKTLKK